MRVDNPFFIVLPVLLLAGTTLIVLAFVFRAKFSNHKNRCSQMTTGVFNGFKLPSGKIFIYEVNGHHYEKTIWLRTRRNYTVFSIQKGTPKEIWYNPDDPTEIWVEDIHRINRYIFPIFLVLGVVFMVIGVVIYVFGIAA